MIGGISGDVLITWGIKPGPGFTQKLETARSLDAKGWSVDRIKTYLDTQFFEPQKIGLRKEPVKTSVALRPETWQDHQNLEKVNELMAGDSPRPWERKKKKE